MAKTPGTGASGTPRRSRLAVSAHRAGDRRGRRARALRALPGAACACSARAVRLGCARRGTLRDRRWRWRGAIRGREDRPARAFRDTAHPTFGHDAQRMEAMKQVTMAIRELV